ncbi:hypothetical protein LXL04_012297 [Taraxacum kok-saghyz]
MSVEDDRRLEMVKVYLRRLSSERKVGTRYGVHFYNDSKFDLVKVIRNLWKAFISPFACHCTLNMQN